MPRPVALANGVIHLNVCVPSKLVGRIRGSCVTRPVGGRPVTVEASDKVIVADQGPVGRQGPLRRRGARPPSPFDATRHAPRALTHRQIVALAGDAYRASVKHYEDESDYVPDGYLREKREFEESIEEFRYDPDDGAGVLGEEDAYMVAAMARPFGVPLLTYELGRDFEFSVAKMSYRDAVTQLARACGHDVSIQTTVECERGASPRRKRSMMMRRPTQHRQAAPAEC